MTFNKFILIFVLTLFSCSAYAQTTKVRGKVTDAETGEPLSFASVAFPGTYVGTTTDIDGLYTFETREDVSEICAMYVSYETVTKPITKGSFNTIDFELKRKANEIERVVVKPGKSRALAILEKVSKNKPLNDPEQKESYSYKSYTKMELDIANMKPEFKNKRMQRNFGFVFNHMDTSALTGKAYLPVMITESSADYYYRRNPKLAREVVRASRISGIEEDYNLAQFTGQLYVNVNIYDNYINIFEVNFASPLCDHGTMYYNYFLVDSTNMDGRKTYVIRFHPKNKAHPAFDGEVHIDSLSWGLRSASMRMHHGVNINWIRDLAIENENRLVGDTAWFYKSNRIIADFSITQKDSSKLQSFMASRQIDYSDIRINTPIPTEIDHMSTNVVYSEAVLNSNEELWTAIRPYELSDREKGIYTMVDSVKNAPLFRNIYETINTVMFGYLKCDKAEVGPYYKLFSFNKFEGNRFQLGLRTTKDFSRRIRLSGYGAYGTKDKEWKGGGSVEYMFNRDPISKLTIFGRHDVLQLGASEGAFSTGNILGSVLARGSKEKLTLIDEFGASFKKEWSPSVTNIFTLRYREMSPTSYVPFTDRAGTSLNHINTTEVSIGTRLSKDAISYSRPFDKYSASNKYPSVDVTLTAGLKDILGGEYEYYRAELSCDYSFNVGPLGRSTAILSGGKIFGTVPYPLLKLHEGNATYIYAKTAYSCMDFYEFASDLWGSVFWEHHFRGFFLGRIPLMKRLQWRELVSAKVLWGTLSDKNNANLANSRAHLLFPPGMSSVSKPYIEVGCGIENIFKIVRIDAVWRLTHREPVNGNKPDKFALNVSLHFDF